MVGITIPASQPIDFILFFNLTQASRLCSIGTFYETKERPCAWIRATLPDAAPSCGSGSVGRFADFVLVVELGRRPAT